VNKLACIATLSLALTAGLAACKDKGEATTPDPTQSPAGDTYKDSKQDKKEWGSWRWQGRGQDCFFKVENQCFSEMAAACKAAGCAEGTCGHDDSAPANVSCSRTD
jgi:hypothetical protein